MLAMPDPKEMLIAALTAKLALCERELTELRTMMQRSLNHIKQNPSQVVADIATGQPAPEEWPWREEEQHHE